MTAALHTNSSRANYSDCARHLMRWASAQANMNAPAFAKALGIKEKQRAFDLLEPNGHAIISDYEWNKFQAAYSAGLFPKVPKDAAAIMQTTSINANLTQAEFAQIMNMSATKVRRLWKGKCVKGVAGDTWLLFLKLKAEGLFTEIPDTAATLMKDAKTAHNLSIPEFARQLEITKDRLNHILYSNIIIKPSDFNKFLAWSSKFLLILIAVNTTVALYTHKCKNNI